jgi:hypothetical protein
MKIIEMSRFAAGAQRGPKERVRGRTLVRRGPCARLRAARYHHPSNSGDQPV